MSSTFDEREFGTIIRTVLRTARESDNNTWYVEKDDFLTGEFSNDDWRRLLCDVARLCTSYGTANIGEIIEIPMLDWRDARDYAATFYGDFVCMFDGAPRERIDDDTAAIRRRLRARRRRLQTWSQPLTLQYVRGKKG